MHKKKKALVFVNVGTPDKPEKKYVRRYLFQFLNDFRVIDLPWILQKLLVNVIIVPFRVSKSTNLYKKLWTDEGSPLLIYLNNLVNKVQQKIKDEYHVYGAMRYGNPALKKVLQEIHSNSINSIIIFPLYPHYASSTAGSVFEYVMKILRNWQVIPEIRLIDQFYDHPAFIESYVNNIKNYSPENYNHVVFSYHGLPLRQINKLHSKIDCEECTCDKSMPEHGSHCYKATCYETSRILATKLELNEEQYSTSFQSRLSNNWLSPFTDKTLEILVQKGLKKVLLVAPSFVADCLETTIELDQEYKEMFLKMGGEELTIVKSLNDTEDWVKAIVEILK